MFPLGEIQEYPTSRYLYNHGLCIYINESLNQFFHLLSDERKAKHRTSKSETKIEENQEEIWDNHREAAEVHRQGILLSLKIQTQMLQTSNRNSLHFLTCWL